MENNNSINPIEAYDEKVRLIFLISLFFQEKNLEGEFEEWCLEKKLDFKLYNNEA